MNPRAVAKIEKRQRASIAQSDTHLNRYLRHVLNPNRPEIVPAPVFRQDPEAQRAGVAVISCSATARSVDSVTPLIR
jgi:hypothetical protein